MKQAIVRIQCIDANGTERFIGTGILVTSDHVLTCKHVVRERDPSGRVTDDYHHGYAVYIAECGRIGAHSPIDDEQYDLALLVLDRSVNQTSARLLSHLGRNADRVLRESRKDVLGFANFDEGRSLQTHDVTDRILLTSFQDGEDTNVSEYLSVVQLNGGLPSGCSGGALTVHVAGTAIVVGMIYLGGERAATSRAIMADPLLAFLSRNGVDGLSVINAQNALLSPPSSVQELDALTSEQVKRDQGRNPYRGLHTFRVEDAPFFFGREEETDAVYELLHDYPFVWLIGASGSGKSSLLHAGLMPRAAGSGDTKLAICRPRGDPNGLGELAGAIVQLLHSDLDVIECAKKQKQLSQGLWNGDLSLPALVEIWRRNHPNQRLVLAIDQFEEIFTQRMTSQHAERFIDTLLGGITKDLPLSILISMRADFFGRAMESGALSDAVSKYPKHFLKLMNEAQKRAAIENPAHRMGVSFAPGLTDTLIRDLGDEPGALPLLEFALTQLWDRQSRGELTHQAYTDIGGVRKALTKYADSVAKAFPDDDAAMRELFVQLVRPGEGTEDTREVATRGQIGESRWPLVQKLADHRLVVTGATEDGNTETVEIVHEALIREWQRLQGWMAENRVFRSWQNRLRDSLHDWQKTGEQDDLLLRGARLAEAEEMLIEHSQKIADKERAFIDASCTVRDAMARAVRRRAQRTIGALAATTVVFIGLFAVAVWQYDLARDAEEFAQAASALAEERRKQADEQRSYAIEQQNEAEQQRARAEFNAQEARRALAMSTARKLADQALETIETPGGDVVRGTLLAVESLKLSRTVEGYRAWTAAMELLPKNAIRLPHSGRVQDLDFSSDGKLIATAANEGFHGADGWVDLIDLSDGSAARLIEHNGSIADLNFSPDGSVLLSSSWDRTLAIKILDSDNPADVYTADRPVVASAISSDGRYVAHATDTGEVCVQMFPTFASLRCIQHGTEVSAIRFASLGQSEPVLVTASNGDIIRIWDLSDDTEPREFRHDGPIQNIAVSPNGRLLAASARERREIKVWDLHSGVLTHTFPYDRDQHKRLAFTPDSTILITTSINEGTKAWDLNSADTTPLYFIDDQHARMLLDVDPLGKLMASVEGWWDKVAVFWNVRTGERVFEADHGDAHVMWLQFSPDGKVAATATDTGEIWLWDLQTGKEIWRHSMPDTTFSVIAFSPDGTSLAVGGWPKALLDQPYRDIDGWSTVSIWDAETGQRTHALHDRPSIHTKHISFDQTGDQLSIVSADDTIELIQTASSDDRDYLETGYKNLQSIAFLQDGGLLVNGWQYGGIFRILGSEEITNLVEYSDVSSAAASRRGGTLVTRGTGQHSAVWNVKSGEKQCGFNDKSLYPAVSSDGRYVLRVQSDDLHVLSADDCSVFAKLIVADGLELAHFAHDGEHLVLLTKTGPARLLIWNFMKNAITAKINLGIPATPANWTLLGFEAEGNRIGFRPFGEKDVTVFDTTGARLQVIALNEQFNQHGMTSIRMANGFMALGWENDRDKTMKVEVIDLKTGAQTIAITEEGFVDGNSINIVGQRLYLDTKNGIGVWDLVTKDRIALLPHPKNSCECAFGFAATQDGRKVAVSGFEHKVWLWDVATRKILHELRHDANIKDLWFSDNGKKLIAKDQNETLKIWDAEAGPEVFRLHHGTALLTQSFFTNPTGTLIGAENGGRIKIWRPDGTLLLDRWLGGELGNFSQPVKLHPYRDQAIFQIGDEQSLRVIDIATGDLAFTLDPGAWINDFVYAKDGSKILTVSADNTIRVWSALTGEELNRLPFAGEAKKVAWSDDTNLVAIVEKNETDVQVWSLSARHLVAKLPHYEEKITEIAFRPDSPIIATRVYGKTVRLWDPKTAVPHEVSIPHEKTIFELVQHPTLPLAAARMYEADFVPVWDMETGEEVRRLQLDDFVFDLAISPDGSKLATSSHDAIVRLWNTLSGEEVLQLDHEKPPNEIKFNADGKLIGTYISALESEVLSSTFQEGHLQIWNIATGKKAGEPIVGYINDYGFMAGEKIITAEGTSDSRLKLGAQNLGYFGVRIFSLPGLEEIKRTDTPWQNDRLLLTNDRQIAIHTSHNFKGGEIGFFDTEGHPMPPMLNLPKDRYFGALTFDREWTLASFSEFESTNVIEILRRDETDIAARLVHEDRVGRHERTFSPDGSVIAVTEGSNGVNERIWVWDWANETPIMMLEGAGDPQFTPDGERLISETGRQVKIWRWRTEDLIAEACSRIERNLTKDEWHAFIGTEDRQKTCQALPLPE